MMTTELNVIQTATSVSIMHEFYPLLSCARREDKEAGWGVGGWRVGGIRARNSNGKRTSRGCRNSVQACQRA